MQSGKAILAVAVISLMAGCDGDEPTGPVDLQNDGGVGNQTLVVWADVDLDPRQGGFLANFEVDVLDRDNQPVSDADVTIEWNYSPLHLAESGVAGRYTAQLAGSGAGPLRLRVERDTMYVRGVTLGNIGIHAILEPEPYDTVAANTPLGVRWVSDAEAPFAVLSTRRDNFEVPDGGEFVIPDSLNPARPDQYIQLLRYNEVQLSGGLRGSYFRMEVRTRVEPVRVLDQP